MSYQREREDFIARMTQEGLPLEVTRGLLRAATTLQRTAELACSSEAADRDRVPCPASPVDLKGRPRTVTGPCLCDVSYARSQGREHESVTRITIQDWNTETRVRASLPGGWTIETQGDPRGCVLRVIPPSYAERNTGRDRHNLDAIGVPSGPSRLRF